MINRATKICTILCSLGTAFIVAATIYTILRDMHMLQLAAGSISALGFIGAYSVAKAAIFGV